MIFFVKRTILGVGIGCDATEALASTRPIKFSESFLSSFGVGLISRAKVHLLFKEKAGATDIARALCRNHKGNF